MSLASPLSLASRATAGGESAAGADAADDDPRRVDAQLRGVR
jgi:hypothetical protein